MFSFLGHKMSNPPPLQRLGPHPQALISASVSKVLICKFHFGEKKKSPPSFHVDLFLKRLAANLGLMAGCQPGRALSPTCLLRSLARSLETHTEESRAIKLQGDRKGLVLASKPVLGKLSPTVREPLPAFCGEQEPRHPHLFRFLERKGRGTLGQP